MLPEYQQVIPYTGLLTCRAYTKRTHVFLEQASKTNCPATFIIMAIDRSLRQSFGAEAIVGRYSGDEFNLLLPNTRREAACLAFPTSSSSTTPPNWMIRGPPEKK
jgi:GGDEF domain-containing protein